MLAVRVIPCLLIENGRLVKTIRFKKPTYLGDPRNACRIFNEKEVDELLLLDISETARENKPDFNLISEIVSESFMPVCYGGGIRTPDDIGHLLHLGIEKVAINTQAAEHPEFIHQASQVFGSQSIVVSIDVKKKPNGRYEVWIRGGRKKADLDLAQFALEMEKKGAGEILLNSIDRDGTMTGYDLDLIKMVSRQVGIPVIALGGAGSIADLVQAVKVGGAAAVAAGSLFVFQGIWRAVLISYPTIQELKHAFK